MIVNTGDGKGKSTAAYGMLLRAWGRGMRICVIQFLKAASGQWGEINAARKLGIEWHTTGDGFTWISEDSNDKAALAHDGWELAKKKIVSKSYDLIILDEFTYPLIYQWLDIAEVLEWLIDQRPKDQHLVITGRSAPEKLIAQADLVTEMRQIKHPFQKGIEAQPGVEY